MFPTFPQSIHRSQVNKALDLAIDIARYASLSLVLGAILFLLSFIGGA